MESVTDPKLLENRLFYKLGEFTYDYRKKVLAFGLLACIGMASLIAMGSNWAEPWGVGEHESVQANDLREDAFIDEEEGAEGFVFLVFHESLDDSSQEWQDAVINALADWEEMDDVSIEYSWETNGDERTEFVYSGEDGFWAKNRITINLDRTQAKALYADNHETIEISKDFDSLIHEFRMT
jgi:hypothetical protein